MALCDEDFCSETSLYLARPREWSPVRFPWRQHRTSSSARAMSKNTEELPANPSAFPPSHGRGPPPSRPLVKKRPHRRSPQACDECRLRKRACDAASPCAPCRRASLSEFLYTANLSSPLLLLTLETRLYLSFPSACAATYQQDPRSTGSLASRTRMASADQRYGAPGPWLRPG